MKLAFSTCAIVLMCTAVSGATEQTSEVGTSSDPRFVPLQSQAENGDSEARMELVRLLLAGSGSDRNVERASYWLRRVVIDLEDMDDIFEAMAVLGELRKEVLLEFPEVEVSDPTGLGGSVGLALWPTDHNLGAEVMIREAWLLNVSAQSGLSTVHRMSAGGAVEPDARIIAYFKNSAEEGLSISMYEYGRFLLFGWSVEQDVERGTELLKKSNRPKAWLALASHASDIGDDVLFEEHLTRAAEYDVPKAIYNLGLLALWDEEYEKAIGFFERTLSLDSGYQPARHELARMHMAGWGMSVDSEKAIEMMEEVSEGDDEELAALAKVNLGMFYFKGQGVEKDETKGIELLEQALAGGSPLAAQVIESLTE